jgi:hypothetical protein
MDYPCLLFFYVLIRFTLLGKAKHTGEKNGSKSKKAL